MPLISRTIPNLVQGISQQPEILRLNSQATSQVNGFSSVVEGLKKRPPTNYIAKLTASSLANAYVHTINRDTQDSVQNASTRPLGYNLISRAIGRGDPKPVCPPS